MSHDVDAFFRRAVGFEHLEQRRIVDDAKRIERRDFAAKPDDLDARNLAKLANDRLELRGQN
jgi:hypothetical protein